MQLIRAITKVGNKTKTRGVKQNIAHEESDVQIKPKTMAL